MIGNDISPIQSENDSPPIDEELNDEDAIELNDTGVKNPETSLEILDVLENPVQYSKLSEKRKSKRRRKKKKKKRKKNKYRKMKNVSLEVVLKK